MLALASGTRGRVVHIHEYQAKGLLQQRGVTVPAGTVATNPEDAGRAYDALGCAGAVVKAQIHAGGRGKAWGVLDASSRAEAEAAARRLLGTSLVTGQTGPAGLPVERVLVEERLDAAQEFYLSLCLDDETGCPMALASARGGTEIERLEASEPGALATERGDPSRGLEPFQARRLCGRLGLPGPLLGSMAGIVHAVARAFVDLDCTLIEVNPLVRCTDDRLVAADLKMTFDDNALSLHPEVAELHDPGQNDPRDEEAARAGLSYVGLEGSIGCMVNGAGLAMATLDLIRMHGGEPANFLDVGGTATAERVAEGFRLICRDERVKAILVNVFGGIVHCDVVADGIITAARTMDIRIPLVVRLAGTNAREGLQALAESGLGVVSLESFDAATAKAVEMATR